MGVSKLNKMSDYRQLKEDNYDTVYFKGFGIIKKGKTYQAEAYANPTFLNTNLNKLKKDINKYLSS